MHINMNFKCVMNSNILFFIILFFSRSSFGQECSSDGINCISCTEYQNCNGGLPQGRVISCKIGDSCADNELKLCQMKLNCYAQNECTQAGIFPDVMVDSNYYVCLNDASSGFLKYEFTCPEGNFFDKGSLTCVPREVTLDVTEVPSSSSVDPTFSSPTSTSADPTSSTSTDPTSSTSADPTSSTSTDPTSSTSTDPTSSTSADPTSSTSTDPTSTSTTPSSTSVEPSSSSSTNPPSTTPTISTSPSTPTTPSPTTTPFTCTAAGIFPNPDNCKMYYRCSTSLKAFFYICPGNSYFNENILKCSMIISPACQAQILKNSTSTLPPSTTTTPPTTTPATTTTASTTTTATTTTSTTTTTTTTPATTTTTTTTTTQAPVTTTTPSSSTPFSCPMSGIFANPLSCKTYYRCALSGQIFEYVCPGNTYFNEFTKRCSLIITPRCRSLIQS